MDHYVFNLDLDTWGLTSKEKEIARFSPFMKEDVISRSNALFGYEGDKYYFDINIRTHFGLDKYEGNMIPYWKTETVEAMDAFKWKQNYQTGAGECVSLAVLYAAAFFVVGRIPLADMFLMGTPLHSQNFVDMDDGVLTNNRRLVTKTMWFNGTELSAQARRALEHEQVTVVAHETGWIHCVYEDATIDPGAYGRLADRLRSYLKTDLTDEILGNFLRHRHDIQCCFQMRWPLHGVDHYISMDKVFGFEHDGPYTIGAATRAKLMAEIDQEEFVTSPLPERIVLNDMEAFIREERISLDHPMDAARLRAKFACSCFNASKAVEALISFCHTIPRLPGPAAKRAPEPEPLRIDAGMSRDEIEARLQGIRDRNSAADLCFHAFRDVRRTGPDAFLHSALRRSPVSIAASRNMDEAAIEQAVREMPDESIYDGPGRLAQPDEVWNYRRGDGVEKAVLLANVLRARRPGDEMQISIEGKKILLKAGPKAYDFVSHKNLPDQVWKVPEV
jgi:hypothetical protein